MLSTSQLTLPDFELGARPQKGIEAPLIRQKKAEPSKKTLPAQKLTYGRGHKKPQRDPVLDRWNLPGEQGFYQWLHDVEPQIITRKNVYGIFKPTPDQRQDISEILAIDKKTGRYKHNLSILCEPRRFGKSLIFAIIVLWLVSAKDNMRVQLLGNTESHSREVQFEKLEEIILHTPKLVKIFNPAENITQFQILNPRNDSRIAMQTGRNLATSFGMRISLLWVSDLMACTDLRPFNALMAGLLDSEDALLFADTNTDEIDGVVHNLEKEAKVDKGIFSRHVEFRNLRHFDHDAPEWVDRVWAHRMKRTNLPSAFKRDVLGQRSALLNALFTPELIEKCKDSYKLPVEDISSFTKGRAFRIGGGLDRSKGLFGELQNADNTVWTSTLVIPSIEKGGESEFYLLNQETVFPNTAKNIKRIIMKDHERYHLDHVLLEAYETVDILAWLQDQGINAESVIPSDNNQSSAFTEMLRLAREGRLHFPGTAKQLIKELGNFTYKLRKGGQKASFGASGRRNHDDRIFSYAWALYSLKDVVLQLYVLGNIQCKNKSAKRGVCILFGGSIELFCSRKCSAFQDLNEKYKSYRAARPEDDISLEEFFKTKVRLTGARISQAV